jgi:hypothetical protein
VNFTSRSPNITLVHSSSMTPPLGLADVQLSLPEIWFLLKTLLLQPTIE